MNKPPKGASQQPGPPAKRARTGPGPGGMSSGSDGETAKRGLIAVNNLRYELAPDLSVVTSRTMHSQVFHTGKYEPEQRMVTQWNSGSAYIDAANSYLEFELEVTHSLHSRVAFGMGSATSLFKDVSIVSRSGDEIERTEQIWSIMPEQDRMHRPTDWFSTVGSLAGYNASSCPKVLPHPLVSPVNGQLAAAFYDRPYSTTLLNSNYTLTPLVNSDEYTDMRQIDGRSELCTQSDVNTVGYALGDTMARHGNKGESHSNTPVNDVDYITNSSFVSDYNANPDNNINGVDRLVTKKKFLIPLSSLSQFFRTTDKLIPAALASGLRVEFQLNPATLPFVAYDMLPTKAGEAEAWKLNGAPYNDPLISYVITNPRMLLDSYQLTDSIQRAMNETIASSGIEMPYVASYHTGYIQGGNSNQFNIEIRKAVSRALTVVTKPISTLAARTTALDAHNTPENKYVQGVGFNLTSYQARVGSLHFPHQPLANVNPASLVKDLYHHTLRGGAAAFKRPNAPGATSWSRFCTDKTVIWTDLERSSVQNLTGIPINNSRVVELMLTTKNGMLNKNLELQTFLFYVRLVRVFLNNVEVEE
jgi:hypothetical protein